jgi:hypothetical protein
VVAVDAGPAGIGGDDGGEELVYIFGGVLFMGIFSGY